MWFFVLRPLLLCKHSFDAPRRAEDVERFRETVIVNQSSVYREQSHHQHDVAAIKEGPPDLRWKTFEDYSKNS